MVIYCIIEVMVVDKLWIEDVILYYYGSEWYVVYNVSFDCCVLFEMFGEWICIMKLVCCLWFGIKYSNMVLYKICKFNVQMLLGLYYYCVLYDCYIIVVLFIDIMNIFGWMVEQMVDIIGCLLLMMIFIFGKYCGKVVFDVVECDLGYLCWLFNNLDSMSLELCLILKYYLENIQFVGVVGNVFCVSVIRKVYFIVMFLYDLK